MAVRIGPKPQKFTFSASYMTKDNQLAASALTIKYLSAAKMDDLFQSRLRGQLDRLIEDYVADTFLYDVTTDRNTPKDLLKKMTELVKGALKATPKPTPAIKLDEIVLIIKRER